MGTVRRQCGDKDRSKGSKDSVMETLTTITDYSDYSCRSSTIPYSILLLHTQLHTQLHTSTPFSSTDKRRRQNWGRIGGALSGDSDIPPPEECFVGGRPVRKRDRACT